LKTPPSISFERLFDDVNLPMILFFENKKGYEYFLVPYEFIVGDELFI
jgi:hypothetical protein